MPGTLPAPTAFLVIQRWNIYYLESLKSVYYLTLSLEILQNVMYKSYIKSLYYQPLPPILHTYILYTSFGVLYIAHRQSSK